MNDKDNDDDEDNRGLHISKNSIDCLSCRCNRKIFHKETKTTTDTEGNIVVNKTEDRSSWRLGSGRNATPEGNKIFETNINDDEDVDTINTGFGSRRPTPEDRLDRLEVEVEKIETDVERIDKDVSILKKNTFNSLD